MTHPYNTVARRRGASHKSGTPTGAWAVVEHGKRIPYCELLISGLRGCIHFFRKRRDWDQIRD